MASQKQPQLPASGKFGRIKVRAFSNLAFSICYFEADADSKYAQFPRLPSGSGLSSVVRTGPEGPGFDRGARCGEQIAFQVMSAKLPFS